MNDKLNLDLSSKEFEKHPRFDSWNDSHMVALATIKLREERILSTKDQKKLIDLHETHRGKPEQPKIKCYNEEIT